MNIFFLFCGFPFKPQTIFLLFMTAPLPRCPYNAALYAHNIAPPTRTKAVVNNKSETRKIM